MELLVRGEDPESDDGKLLIRVEAESSAVRTTWVLVKPYAGKPHTHQHKACVTHGSICGA